MLLSPFLGFIYFLYLNLYYLVDDASMGWGSLMQTKHLFVLNHYRNNGEVLGPLVIFTGCSSVDLFVI